MILNLCTHSWYCKWYVALLCVANVELTDFRYNFLCTPFPWSSFFIV